MTEILKEAIKYPPIFIRKNFKHTEIRIEYYYSYTYVCMYIHT